MESYLIFFKNFQRFFVMNYSLGIDIGSTTVKVALLDENKNRKYSDYRRHYANIKEIYLHS